MPVKAHRWVVFAVILAACVCAAVFMYQGMNSDGYRAGNWALVFCVPVVAVPMLYGIGLVGEVLAHRRYLRRWRAAAARPAGPTCDRCGVRVASWNTRTSQWMDTCGSCRNPDYFDNDNMIG